MECLGVVSSHHLDAASKILFLPQLDTAGPLESSFSRIFNHGSGNIPPAEDQLPLFYEVPKRSWALIWRGQTLIWRGLRSQIPMVLRYQELFGASGVNFKKFARVAILQARSSVSMPSDALRRTGGGDTEGGCSFQLARLWVVCE